MILTNYLRPVVCICNFSSRTFTKSLKTKSRPISLVSDSYSKIFARGFNSETAERRKKMRQPECRFVPLSNGVEMPRLGLGTFKARGEEARRATLWALEAGYTHIDTASIYKNEEEIGNACREVGIDREKLFITSKVSPYEQGYEKAMAACNKSLERLGMDYLVPLRAETCRKSELNQSVRQDTWRALEQLYREGKCRAIGVSNYTSSHLREMMRSSQVLPMVNQVEVHPYLTQESLRQTCKEMRIQVVAYASLGCGELLKDPLVISTATHYGRTPAQILLRWGLERDLVVIPKSLRREKIYENADIFDWNIEDTHLIPLDTLNKERHFCWSPEGVL